MENWQVAISCTRIMHLKLMVYKITIFQKFAMYIILLNGHMNGLQAIQVFTLCMTGYKR